MVCHLWTGLGFFLFSPCASAAVDGKSSITQLLISVWWNVDTAPARHPGRGWRFKLSSNRRWWQSNATLHHLQWVACKGAGRVFLPRCLKNNSSLFLCWPCIKSIHTNPVLFRDRCLSAILSCSKVISHARWGGAVGQIRCVTKNKQPQLTTTLPRGQGVCPNHSWLPPNSRYACKTDHYACKLVSLNAWQTRMGGNPTD